MNTAGIVAVAIEVYGALLTSYSVVLARRQTLPRVIVTLGFAPASRLAVSARNVGRLTVTVEQAGLALAGGTPLPVPIMRSRTRLPLALGEGQRCGVAFNCRAVARALLSAQRFGRVDVCGFVIIADGARVCRVPLAFDVAVWRAAAGPYSRQSVPMNG